MTGSGARFTSLALLVAVALAGACAPAAAPRAEAPPAPAPRAPAAPAKAAAAPSAPAVSFGGKTVTILVPYTVGGSADIRARQMLPFMGKHFPGEPTVIVQNMPGGGGLVGENWVYNVAPKDGTVIGQFVFPVMVVQTVFSPEKVRFDLAKLRWLGGMSEPNVTFAHTNLGIKSAEDLPKVTQKIFLGDTSPESPRGMFGRLFLRLLEKDHSYVSGYGSSSDMRAAIRRGELNITADSLAGYFQAVRPMIEEGVVVPLAQTGTVQDGKVVRDPRLPDIPTYTELLLKLKGEAVRQKPEFRAMELLASVYALLEGWVYVPGVPEATYATTATAFDKLLADPELEKAFEESTGLKPLILSRAQAQQTADSVVTLLQKDPEAVEVMKQVAKEAKEPS